MTRGAPVIAPPTDLDVVVGARAIDQKAIERAWRATSRFRAMIPQLQAFVRAVTRNPDVHVEVTAGTPCTDGRTVWLRPPIELGDDLDHDRSVCGDRDPDTLQHLCPAHARHESIMRTLFHECAHICFDSFESLRDADRAELVRRAVMERPAISTTRLGKLQKKLDGLRPGASYVEVNNLLSPYLPMIFNALEDARVNRMMYEARSGTRVWFQAGAIRIFEHGLENPDGSVHKWSECGRNAQVIIGLYCRASGFDIKGWFVPDVEAALADPELARFLARVATARSAASVYRLGFPMLERLRQLGFCTRPDEPEDDPPPPPPTPKPPAPTDEEGDDEGDGGKGKGKGESGDAGGGVPEDDSEGGGSAVAPEDLPDDDDEVDEPGADGTEEGAEATDEGGDVDTDVDDPIGDEGDDESEGGDDGESDEDEPEDDADDEGDDDDDWDDDDEGGDAADDGADEDASADDPEEDPSDVAGALAVFGGHGPVSTTASDRDDAEAINRAVVQGGDFDAPSRSVLRVNVHRWDTRNERARMLGWHDDSRSSDLYRKVWDPSEQLLSKALFKMRTTFAFNRASRTQNGLKHGRVDSKTVHRAAMGDRDVFAKTRIPGKREYFVCIGIDISGSTGSYLRGHDISKIDLAKQAAMAMAELCHRVGVKFAVYAHTGHHVTYGGGMPGLKKSAPSAGRLFAVDEFEVKAPHEPWTEETRNRLRRLSSGAANLDGHSLEFYRKLTERESATDKIILYFTDGAMPCENYDDELAVLQREIGVCKRLGIHLVGVGIVTDAPTEHGLDTVQIDKVDDLPKVITKLERELTKPRVG